MTSGDQLLESKVLSELGRFTSPPSWQAGLISALDSLVSGPDDEELLKEAPWHREIEVDGPGKWLRLIGVA